ncbi:MAG: hypothetical protein C0617_07650 [Desulfuromonas sp.]|uniref:FliH/SctL family protein n=1 Tax=Desulfuromonas sp. TaxID=892 RepID=UPI000CBCBC2A|nr:FliH/SctL family protein [Desulfuromonas sp.]PLX84498.1 MAG: hypothetical protein C0617_07650 [Desulfuromonas sp.]
MSLSRVYKGSSVSGLRSMHFEEFGTAAAGQHSPAPAADAPGGFSSLWKDEADPAGPVPAEALPENPPEESLPEEPAGNSSAAPDLSAGQPAKAPDVDHEQQLAAAFASGRQAGIEQVEERMDDLAQAFGTALEEISRLRETLLKNSTRDMVRLVMAVAEQVIHCEVTANPEVVLGAVKGALQASLGCDELQVRVNAEDYALLTEKKPLFLASISGLKNIVFEADPAVARGGCLVESEFGEVDATIASQTEEIRQNLLKGILAA